MATNSKLFSTVAYAFESQSNTSRYIADITGWIACGRHDVSKTVGRIWKNVKSYFAIFIPFEFKI